mmetsp:Transcript_33391/g.65135  ORF Transcript_33391/g.65135 Transcript_33391/m.65135 type:complete len:107 (-) Transcript_33391:32-352(-)
MSGEGGAVRLSIEFGGGLELLFGGVKSHSVSVPPEAAGGPLKMKHLVVWIRDKLCKERPEMFTQGSAVRPGILVLINDADWELTDGPETLLEEGDEVSFISTLHGG